MKLYGQSISLNQKFNCIFPIIYMNLILLKNITCSSHATIKKNTILHLQTTSLIDRLKHRVENLNLSHT